MICWSKSPVCKGQWAVTVKCARALLTAQLSVGVKHLPEVVEVKSSLYLKLIRLDNKFNFIAIFSLTVKIQYFRPLSPPLPAREHNGAVGGSVLQSGPAEPPGPSLAKLITWNFEIIIKTSNSAK